ncbi:hypothetical protein HLB23_37225 [Nocardia uniformis]|uniref:Uncharacterized protein n=1 Tax=Nocardia uniformis TaxID=53432 RepID=A0A849CHI2_9NOCA|nr:hypothetical protein [Nocardia uniformis]NNH75429.1 hypothetical protein [Nocardia uniformis]
MHFDRKLARAVVEQVLEEPLRAVVQSPAVDLEAVCRHAVAAQRRHAVRDGALVAAWVIWILYWVVSAYSGFAPPGLFVFAGMLSGLPLFVLLTWFIVFVDSYLVRWGATARSLRYGVFQPDRAPVPQTDLARRQLTHVTHYAKSNITVYQGYRPFMGHGWSVRGWSFALDITRPHRADEPIEPFTAVDLNERIAQRITDLGLPGTAVGNRMFVSGDDIHHDRRFLPDASGRPVAWVDDTTMAALMLHPENHARPYLTTEIVNWDGEFVWSAFVRAVVSDTSMFVEVNYCVLPPLRMSYHEIDDLLLHPAFRRVLRLMSGSLRALPRAVLFCLPGALRPIFAAWRFDQKVSAQLRRVQEVFTYDHGALISVREAASDLRKNKDIVSLGYHRYFQMLDEQMYTKIVEKRIAETLEQFLTEHNIDPAELLRRTEQIFNSNVTIGGDATLVNSAIGGSSAVAGSSSGRSTPENR